MVSITRSRVLIFFHMELFCTQTFTLHITANKFPLHSNRNYGIKKINCNFAGEHEQETMEESKIEGTLGAETSISTTERTRAPRPIPSDARGTKDAARSRETISQGAAPSVPGK